MRRLGISSPPYAGPVSDHFDGRTFFNQASVGPKGMREFLRWRVTRRPERWRRKELRPGAPPPAEGVPGRVRATFVNHSTVLIQIDGLNILTDPIWSERCSPVSWAGPRRAHPPGVRFEDLPRIDAILLSHNHYDHLDLPTLERLAAAHKPRIFCPLGNRALLEERAIGGGYDMDWWQDDKLGDGVRVTCVPAQHWSSRGTRDRARTLWGGFVIEGPSGMVYFAGDTGDGPHFAQVRERFGAPKLALLPIGAYQPQWFMSPVHMNPREAVAAHRTLEAKASLAIHFGTFSLADDAQEEPLVDLAQAKGEAAVSDREFWVLEPGEGRETG